MKSDATTSSSAQSVPKKVFDSPEIFDLDKTALHSRFLQLLVPLLEKHKIPFETKEAMKQFSLRENKQIKFNLLLDVEELFGREIPNVELHTINNPEDLLNWLLNRVELERPAPKLEVPPNVKLFLFKPRKDQKIKRADWDAPWRKNKLAKSSQRRRRYAARNASIQQKQQQQQQQQQVAATTTA